jgi:hypothetical protein
VSLPVRNRAEALNTPETSTDSPGSILPEFGRTQYSCGDSPDHEQILHVIGTNG